MLHQTDSMFEALAGRAKFSSQIPRVAPDSVSRVSCTDVQVFHAVKEVECTDSSILSPIEGWAIMAKPPKEHKTLS